uniref:uncharacterized protein LOC108949743 n=1 Tax=Ciona intestinalis TaxID=7719 RepID=UPI00089DADA1|nr:uncharacterized protein LOC108949743 [Ciona intestinalis]|eukprot:XP_018668722.1 uncharacterized protein LOC108949743 [Ciona intestinalis]
MMKRLFFVAAFATFFFTVESGSSSRKYCAECSGTSSPLGSSSQYDLCMNTPSYYVGNYCPYDDYDYCVGVFVDYGPAVGSFVARGCSKQSIGNGCMDITSDDNNTLNDYRVCTSSCKFDNCNIGDIGSGAATLSYEMWLPAIVLFGLLILRQ